MAMSVEQWFGGSRKTVNLKVFLMERCLSVIGVERVWKETAASTNSEDLRSCDGLWRQFHDLVLKGL